MAVGEGKFQLYAFIDPPLDAGDYRFRTEQLLGATGAGGAKDSDDLPVDALDTFVRVRSPRYQLPPDQALSTFPPANSEGSYGQRLPQIVIKRRTLPWERDLFGQPSTTPWLALVLIAEGEAELKLNQPVEQCVTPGIALGGIADSQLGNYLSVRKSVIDKVFPTRKDVPLLAHAREVDIHDTELMMGDDDGFLAVVVANRLPVAGHDANGNEVPVKYLACLVNLEGQFDALLPEAPPPLRFSLLDVYATQALTVSGWDHVLSGQTTNPTLSIGSSSVVFDPLDDGPLGDAVHDGPLADEFGQAKTHYTAMPPGGAQAFEPTVQWALDDAVLVDSNVYVDMAKDFAIVSAVSQVSPIDAIVAHLDPVHRFPVLIHWSFTSTGDTTFQYLMEHLDSGLLSTLPIPPRSPTPNPARPPSPNPARPPTPGRDPLEVVETGHVGLAHRTRRGDQVRAWYRGPLVPHPTQDPPDGRLKLAHASDQLRIVVPDGREDLSLAAAFEIGRLLALSRPAMVGSMLRWRQTGYQAARRRSIWGGNRDFLDEFVGGVDAFQLDRALHVVLGREFVKRVAVRPGDLLGPPRAMFDPGRALELDGTSIDLMAAGFGFESRSLGVSPIELLDGIRDTVVPVAGTFTERLDSRLTSATLHVGLDRTLVDLVSDTLAPNFVEHPVVGPTIPRTEPRDEPAPDRLDALLHDEADHDETEAPT